MCFALETFALKAILDRYLVRLPALVAFLSFAISIDDAFFPVLKKISRSGQAKVQYSECSLARKKNLSEDDTIELDIGMNESGCVRHIQPAGKKIEIDTKKEFAMQ